MPEPWEYEIFAKAKEIDARSTPAMRSWSRSFRHRAMWGLYTRMWREHRASQVEPETKA